MHKYMKQLRSRLSVCSGQQFGQQLSVITSGNMEVNTASKKRVFIRLPKEYMAALAETYDLDHGLFIQELNPYINEGYVRAYFRDWGTVTRCKISHKARENKAVAFVAFSTEDEADRAEWAGPHYIGGCVEVKRVVSPKMEEDEEETVTAAAARRPPKRHMGLGYMLEDAEWLDEEMDDKSSTL